MTAIIPFSFEGAPVRVVSRSGDPWFVASDVANVLEIGRTDDAVRRLDDDEKGADTIRTPGGMQSMTVINESGLYSLILTSRKPAARRFKKWVTAEVLPTLRRTGSYTAPGVELPHSSPADEERWLRKVSRSYRMFGPLAAAEVWNDPASPLTRLSDAALAGVRTTGRLDTASGRGRRDVRDGHSLTPVPRNTGLVDRGDTLVRWWDSVLAAGGFLAGAPWPQQISVSAIYDHYCRFAERVGGRPLLRNQFGRLLGRLMPLDGFLGHQKVRVGGVRLNGYHLPPLADCRAVFERLTGSKMS